MAIGKLATQRLHVPYVHLRFTSAFTAFDSPAQTMAVARVTTAAPLDAPAMVCVSSAKQLPAVNGRKKGAPTNSCVHGRMHGRVAKHALTWAL